MWPPPDDITVSGYDTEVSEGFQQTDEIVVLSRRPIARLRVRRGVADIEHRAQQFELGKHSLRLRNHVRGQVLAGIGTLY